MIVVSMQLQAKTIYSLWLQATIKVLLCQVQTGFQLSNSISLVPEIKVVCPMLIHRTYDFYFGDRRYEKNLVFVENRVFDAGLNMALCIIIKCRNSSYVEFMKFLLIFEFHLYM